MIDEREILDAEEIKAVVSSLRTRKNKNAAVNRIMFRLSCCCGLRRKEICGLNLENVIVTGKYPRIEITKANTKGIMTKRRSRRSPLWWDAGTLEDIRMWTAKRMMDGAQPGDPFVCQQNKNSYGDRIKVKSASLRWRTAISALPADRIADLSIHTGRHTFVSHALAGGRSLAEVMFAVGHGSLRTTQIYLHLVARDGVPDLFPEEQKVEY